MGTHSLYSTQGKGWSIVISLGVVTIKIISISRSSWELEVMLSLGEWGMGKMTIRVLMENLVWWLKMTDWWWMNQLNDHKSTKSGFDRLRLCFWLDPGRFWYKTKWPMQYITTMQYELQSNDLYWNWNCSGSLGFSPRLFLLLWFFF